MMLLLNLEGASQTYPIIDTGQQTCYDSTAAITPPLPSDPFYGQDAQYQGIQFAYQDNSDGTITDLDTDLMWQQMPDLYDKPTYAEAVAGADTFSLAGYNDWRLPSIKELYSLINFTGSSMTLTAYIDTTYFGFRFGDTSLGERVIDGQYWSSTEYVGTTMNNDPTVFGVNFADGRIKGYPRDIGPGGQPNRQFVRYVRGNQGYGVNDFVDNGDGTISDLATGLMWQQGDSGDTLNWEQALAYAEGLVLAGFDDWRLPNAKELQSIVDYTRAPDATNPAQQGPAIDTSYFDVTEPESWFWSSTTLLEAPPHLGYGSHAVYVTFGQAFGYMGPPGMGQWLNVHGAGAQRSDPKSGDPANYPYGFGPQGDQIRIYNYIRCVRDASTSHSGPVKHPDPYRNPNLALNPNPANPATLISFYLHSSQNIDLSIYNILGQNIITLARGSQPSGQYNYIWDASSMPSGMYIVSLVTPTSITTQKLIIVK